MLDPIPAPIASLLALFEGALASVKFPDVDSAVLASAVAQSRASAEAVANAEAALDRARTAFPESHDALLVRAQRALARTTSRGCCSSRKRAPTRSLASLHHPT